MNKNNIMGEISSFYSATLTKSNQPVSFLDPQSQRCCGFCVSVAANAIICKSRFSCWICTLAEVPASIDKPTNLYKYKRRLEEYCTSLPSCRRLHPWQACLIPAGDWRLEGERCILVYMSNFTCAAGPTVWKIWRFSKRITPQCCPPCSACEVFWA